ncbi:MAG: hypothetical protein ACQEVT_13130 [Pseudomonadota bacterium]|uniref:hypothetical protein n=1 Tax=Roseovarius TaxID=74030 RepID=UPI0022A81796|nr:hypothetical protein [Roseovarius sp. EGI FJ00037]MCZ0813772.1 hypothetical protein [Roseovarius sp. EGI FJ00037]
MTYDHTIPAAESLQPILAKSRVPSEKRKGRRIAGKLGHEPETALRAMRDFGLCDREIARYYEVTPSTIRRLERYYGIDHYP